MDVGKQVGDLPSLDWDSYTIAPSENKDASSGAYLGANWWFVFIYSMISSSAFLSLIYIW